MNTIQATKLIVGILTLILNASFAKAEGWSDSFSTLDETRWSSLGAFSTPGSGIILGPSNGDYAISGIKTLSSIGDPSSGVKVTAEFTDFDVSTSAPSDADNGNDIRAMIAIASKGELPPWENPGAWATVRLFYNKENNGIYAGITAKPVDKPNDDGDFLGGEFLGEGIGKSVIKVTTELKGTSLTVDFHVNGDKVASLHKTLDKLGEGLGTEAYLQVWEQNISTGTGKVKLNSISVD